MKKSTRNKIIAIFFALVMLFPGFIYLQKYNLFGSDQQQNQGKLPSNNIVQQRLDDATEQLIISQQGTVVQFYYSVDCAQCGRQKSVLENYVSQNTGQIYLEEIQSSNAVAQNIIMKSYRDTKILSNANDSDIQNAFCDVLLQPPAQCALRNLNTS